MEFLYNLFTPCMVALADTPSTNLFAVIENGAYVFINTIKWFALIYVAVRAVMLGMKIASSSKKSSDAITLIKDEGGALAIGVLIVALAFMIQGALKDVITTIGTSTSTTGGVNTGTGDDFWG